MQKKPIKVIIDTNLWISFLISKRLINLDNLILNSKIRLVFSMELLDEFISVVSKPKFSEYFDKHDIEKLITLFDTFGVVCSVNSKIKLCRDKKDNFLLSLAKDSNADYLITGDKDLLEIKQIHNARILTYSEFEKIFNKK